MFHFLTRSSQSQSSQSQSSQSQSSQSQSSQSAGAKASIKVLVAATILSMASPSAGIAQPSQSITSSTQAIPLPAGQAAAANRQIVSRRPSRPRPPRRLPPNQVQPGGGLDAAARSCDPNSSALTALVPVENPVFTASAHPTFLFYLPDAPEQVAYAEFILLGADEKEEIYTAQFVPTQSGVVSISLPEQPAYALEADQAYHWYFNLHCKTAKVDDESTPAVNGWVQRLSDSESPDPLPYDLPEGLPEGLAENLPETAVPEVWYDAIAQVAETLIANPTPENQQLWENWLSAVGLAEIADAPVVGPASINPDL